MSIFKYYIHDLLFLSHLLFFIKKNMVVIGVIDKLSLKLTNIIKNNLDDISEEKAEEINYGLNVIIYEVFITIVLIPLIILSGLLKYCITYMIVYGILRIFTGGSHARTRLACFLTYATSLFGISMLSKLLPAMHIVLVILIFLAALCIFIIYVPGDTVEKPIKSRKMMKRLKFISIMLLIYIFVITIIVGHFNSGIYNVITLAVAQVSFFLTPIGYKLYSCKRSSQVQE
jgi:accessory gene regulator B